MKGTIITCVLAGLTATLLIDASANDFVAQSADTFDAAPADEFRSGSIPPNSNFARNAAGAFLIELEFAGLPLKALLVLHADGTLTSHVQQSFGAPTGIPEAALDFNGPLYGNWTRTGSHEIRIVSLQLLYENADLTGAHGTVTALAKLAGPVVYSPNFDELEGLISIDLFTPDQDPLVDDPVNVNELPFTARRIQ